MAPAWRTEPRTALVCYGAFMFDVPCGPDRITLDVATLVHVQPPLEWATTWQGHPGGLLLSLDGADDGPYERLVDLAELVLPRLAVLETTADAYLRSWIDVGAQFFEGAWKLRGLRLAWEGLTGPLRGIDFELVLSIRGDDYGEWSVRFKRHTVPRSVFAAYAFSRRQW
ncbi:Hypothetical protein A7982_10095 [Minicystis rosea]|nr:Hypothetical protein A7982_10095 [Minicystis rosea]